LLYEFDAQKEENPRELKLSLVESSWENRDEKMLQTQQESQSEKAARLLTRLKAYGFSHT
jgi:hypothetical protein